MSKRKSSVGSDGGKHTRTSERANRGQGGRTDQLTRVGEALAAKPLRKKVRGSGTVDEPVNPMAPVNTENSRSKQRSLKSNDVPHSTTTDNLKVKVTRVKNADSTVSGNKKAKAIVPVRQPAVPNGRFGFRPGGAEAVRTSHSLQPTPVAPGRSSLRSPIASQSRSRKALQESQTWSDGSDHDMETQPLRFPSSSNDPDLQHEDHVEIGFNSHHLEDDDMNGSDPDVPAEVEAGNSDGDADGDAYDGDAYDGDAYDGDGDGVGLGDVDVDAVVSGELSEIEYDDPPAPQVNSKTVRVHVDNDKRPRHGDVLQNHHKKNGRPRAPNADDLLRLSKANPVQQPKSLANALLEDEDAGDPKKSKAPKCSKTSKEDNTASPTTLAFYPHHWKALLRYAKSEMRLYCATVNLFSPLEVILESCAREILSQSVTKWKEEDRGLEEDMYPDHKIEMHRLIADECANFRSILKKVAIAAVTKHYDLYPKSGAVKDHVAYYKYAKQAAFALLEESDFLRDGRDEMGKPRNFAHPAIREGCLQVYYKSSKYPLGRKKLFEYGIPLISVAVVTTAIMHVLKSVRTHGHTKTVSAINADNCVSDYNNVLKSLVALEHDQHHGKRLRKMLKEWGKEGSYTADITDPGDSDNAITLKL